MSEYNITDMAGENQRKIQPGSTIILAVFLLKAYPPYKDLGPSGNLSSSTCDQSLGIVSGFYSEK